MQQQAVEILGAQVLERKCTRLLDLLRQRRGRIVRDAARILTGQRRELGLQVQRGTREAELRTGRDASANSALVIVLRLAGGIEAAKTGPERSADVVRRALLLPGRAVDQRRRQGAQSTL